MVFQFGFEPRCDSVLTRSGGGFQGRAAKCSIHGAEINRRNREGNGTRGSEGTGFEGDWAGMEGALNVYITFFKCVQK